ncbi:MAG: DUF4303 domain-containing protein [Negativicutes bacterium]
MRNEEVIAQISADMDTFLNEHPHLEFYALAFDCNSEYAEFLVGMNTQEDFLKMLQEYQENNEKYCTDAASIKKLRYNPGDWTYADISGVELFTEEALIEKYQDDIERQCADMLRLCEEILSTFRKTEIFKRIPKTQDFVSFCIDHDEDPADALARGASDLTGMQA